MIFNGEEVYSVDGELFEEDLCTVLDMADEGGLAKIHIGEAVMYQHSDFIDADLLIERAQENCHDNCHEDFSQDYLVDLKDSDVKELKKIICDFLDKRAAKPKFYNVVNVVEVDAEEMR